MIKQRSLLYEGKPLWVGAVSTTYLAFAAAFIAWRLVRRRMSANGVTLLPTWFIQLFVAFIFCVVCLIAYFLFVEKFFAEGATGQ